MSCAHFVVQAMMTNSADANPACCRSCVGPDLLPAADCGQAPAAVLSMPCNTAPCLSHTWQVQLHPVHDVQLANPCRMPLMDRGCRSFAAMLTITEEVPMIANC